MIHDDFWHPEACRVPLSDAEVLCFASNYWHPDLAMTALPDLGGGMLLMMRARWREWATTSVCNVDQGFE